MHRSRGPPFDWFTLLLLLFGGGGSGGDPSRVDVVEQFVLAFSDAPIADVVWVSGMSQEARDDVDAFETNR